MQETGQEGAKTGIASFRTGAPPQSKLLTKGNDVPLTSPSTEDVDLLFANNAAILCQEKPGYRTCPLDTYLGIKKPPMGEGGQTCQACWGKHVINNRLS